MTQTNYKILCPEDEQIYYTNIETSIYKLLALEEGYT